jgi:nitrate reductase assembly molybdenum cofactor insertion protein NarJ
MTTAEIAAWDAVAALIEYPTDETYGARLRACAAELESLGLPAAAPLARLRDAVDGRSLTSLQEAYAAAFDFDPESTLYVGWHLFEDGPDWGPWLATLADRLDRAGVERTPELPDHLSRLLMLIAREEDTQARALTEIIAPPLQKVHKRLVERGSPFAPLVETAGCLLDGCVENMRVGRD